MPSKGEVLLEIWIGVGFSREKNDMWLGPK